jgi:hypothetical protein
MRWARATVAFVWEFVVGDDWVVAAGVVVGLGITALVAEQGAAWFVMPLVVAVLLTQSVWRAARKKPELPGR